MKTLTAFGVAIAAIALSGAASAQTRVITAHAATASALKCLLEHDRDACGYSFVGSASGNAKNWLWWNAADDFDLGPLLSAKYVGTEPENAYTANLLHGRTADVYAVTFQRQRKTFYIARPGPDGKVHYMLIRDGAPSDELTDLWARNPLGLF